MTGGTLGNGVFQTITRQNVQYDKNGPYHVNFLHFLHLVEVRFVGFGQFSFYGFVALRGLR